MTEVEGKGETVQADPAGANELSDLTFDRFYQTYKDRIVSYLFKLTGDYQNSLDFMQESFARYFSRYRHREKSQALLFTIARNTVFDSARKNKRETVADSIEPVCDETPEAQLIQKQKGAHIARAFGQLSSDDQQLLSMVSSQNLTYRQIGNRLGLSESNVKVRVHRARIRLMGLLKNGEEQ